MRKKPSLTEVFLLFEEDKRRQIMQQFRMSQAFADWFHGLDQRLSFVMAHVFVVWMKEHPQGADSQVFSRDLTRHDQQDVAQDASMFMQEIGRKVLNALREDPAKRKEIRNSKTLSDIRKLLSSGETKSLEVVLQLDGGWKWVRLSPEDCEAEGQNMQHCATDNRGDLVSLRDPSNNPHVTMTYNKDKNAVYQIKGKQNKAPDKKYWPHIVKFFSRTKAQFRDAYLRREPGGVELAGQIIKISPVKHEKLMTLSDGSYLAEVENDFVENEGAAIMYALHDASGHQEDFYLTIGDGGYWMQDQEPGYHGGSMIVGPDFFDVLKEVVREMNRQGNVLDTGSFEHAVEMVGSKYEDDAEDMEAYLHALRDAGAMISGDYPFEKYLGDHMELVNGFKKK